MNTAKGAQKMINPTTTIDTAMAGVFKAAPRYLGKLEPKLGEIIAGELVAFQTDANHSEQLILLNERGQIVEIDVFPWLKIALSAQGAKVGDVIGIELRVIVAEPPLF